jgi:hypothetical protein
VKHLWCSRETVGELSWRCYKHVTGLSLLLSDFLPLSDFLKKWPKWTSVTLTIWPLFDFLKKVVRNEALVKLRSFTDGGAASEATFLANQFRLFRCQHE